jgi:hypothetical protein
LYTLISLLTVTRFLLAIVASGSFVNGDQDDEEHSDQAAYMTLNKNLIERLMDWKFISVEK